MIAENLKNGKLKNCRVTKLPNGLTVVSENIPYVKSFSLGFWIKVGSRDENAKNNGISHFIEHMLFKGTPKRSAKKIADEIESLGGYLNAFTTKEHTCYYGRGLAKHLPRTFEVLADMLQNSLFDEKEIRKEAEVIIDELNDIEDSPEEVIFDRLESFLFKNNPLGRPIIGTEANIRSFTRKDFLNYLASQYGFNKIYIVASGDVNHERIVELAEKFFVRNFGKKEFNRPEVKTAPPSEYFVYKEIQQSHFIIARPTVGLTHADRRKINLLSHILGEGSSSRLFQSLREKNGIAYQVNTFLNSFEDVSTFGVYFSTGNNNWEKARELVFREFEKLSEKKVSAKELQRAKEYLKGNFLMGLESTTNRMHRLAYGLMYFGKLKPVEESIREIDEITAEDILETARELLKKDKFSTVVLSSENLLIHSAA